MKTKHIPNRPFKTWSEEEHQTWAKLAQRQIKNVEGRVSKKFFDGFKKLGITLDRVPDGEVLKENLAKATGWKLVSTNLEFADGQSWFEALDRREFFVTEYLRPLDSLDYTPKPDAFHDMFGHLPYVADKQVSNIIDRFTDLMLALPKESRKKLGHLWWYTIEFGFVKESAELKAFGAGLASSFGELNEAFKDLSVVKPLDLKVMSEIKESPFQYHNQYFFLESFEQLEEILENWSMSV